MNLAEKHLSKYGRFGDTEMVRTSKSGPGKGKLWHVNPEEKSLINMYGQQGEKLVDAVGSGTINPVTGKEEKFITAALMGAQVGLSMYQGWKQGKAEKKEAKKQIGMIDTQLSDLDEAEASLYDSTSSQKKLLTEEMSRQSEQLDKSATQQLGISNIQASTMSGKTGFAGSGEMDYQAETAKSDLRDAVEFSRDDMELSYGKMMGEITGQYEAEKARIKGERDRLISERNIARQKSMSFADKVGGSLGGLFDKAKSAVTGGNY